MNIKNNVQGEECNDKYTTDPKLKILGVLINCIQRLENVSMLLYKAYAT